MPETQDAGAAALAPALWLDDIFCPCSDSKPMAENLWPWRAMVEAIGVRRMQVA